MNLDLLAKTLSWMAFITILLVVILIIMLIRKK